MESTASNFYFPNVKERKKKKKIEVKFILDKQVWAVKNNGFRQMIPGLFFCCMVLYECLSIVQTFKQQQ